MKSIHISLQVLLESINKILEYTLGYDLEKFLEDEKTYDACLMQFQHLWEHTNKNKELLKNIDFLPVEEMVGLRNYIAHEYLGISHKIVFHTIQNDLPKLKSAIEWYLKE